MDEGQCQLGLVQCMMRRLQAYWAPRRGTYYHGAGTAVRWSGLYIYGILRCCDHLTPVRAADPGAECGPCPRETVLLDIKTCVVSGQLSPRLR